ncbi:uncharacterized protein LOC115223611, partial [Argonauta hians]
DVSFPSLPAQYSVFIEANYITSGNSVHFMEFHDLERGGDVIRRKQPDPDTNTEVYLFQDTGEMFVVSAKHGFCKISDLWKQPRKFLFGETIFKGKFFSLAGAMELSQSNFLKHKVSSQTVTDRGIVTTVWSMCQYIPSMNATANFTWYFGKSSTLCSAIPVRLHLEGQSNDLTHFEYQLEFFHFTPYILEEEGSPIFQTPLGMSCQGRKLKKPLPDFPQVFSYTTETMNLATGSIQYREEEYDAIHKLVRFTFRPEPDSLYNFSAEKITKIHDYNIDAAYVIDDIRGNCTIQSIFGNSDDIRGDKDSLHMATAKQIFMVDKGVFTYEGIQSVRGYDCDVWITHVNTFPGLPDLTGTIIEWYFTTRQWFSDEQTHAVPKLMRQIDVASKGIEEKNIFNFREKEADILLFDLTPCFEFRDKYKFVFTIPEQHLTNFKRAVIIAVTDNIQISPMRINKINAEFAASGVVASFEIHDKVVVSTGDRLTKPQLELKKAVHLLK